MGVLRERVVWRRHPERSVSGRTLLTPTEQANVRAMLRELRRGYPSWPALARAMGITTKAIEHARDRQRNVTAAVALRVARAAGVPLEAVLAGTWAELHRCPTCEATQGKTRSLLAALKGQGRVRRVDHGQWEVVVKE